MVTGRALWYGIWHGEYRVREASTPFEQYTIVTKLNAHSPKPTT